MGELLIAYPTKQEAADNLHVYAALVVAHGRQDREGVRVQRVHGTYAWGIYLNQYGGNSEATDEASVPASDEAVRPSALPRAGLRPAQVVFSISSTGY